MKSFKGFKGKSIAIMKDNIDTDILIPKEYLKTIRRTGFEDAVFAPWRYDEMGKPVEDFPLNNKEAQGAKILITGDNFGCGSSREHAVWALQDWGIRVVVAGSFSNIFYNNFLNNGNLPVILTLEERHFLASLSPQTDIIIDIDNNLLKAGGKEFSLGLSPVWIERLSKGEDVIDWTLEHLKEIEAYEVLNKQ